MSADPKILSIAFLGGIFPSLLWLWFWLKEEKKKKEPKKILALIFFMGMFSVIFVLPIQKFIQAHIGDNNLRIILWASTEELLKYLAVLAILYHSNYTDDPIDWPIYMVTAALGFAGLENILFLIKPLTSGNIVGILTGELRFLGATLLHTVTSGILGIAIGFSIHKKKIIKKEYFIIGLITAISLHSLFNFFIIQNNGTDFLKVFLSLWIVTIVVMLLFEKIRRMH